MMIYLAVLLLSAATLALEILLTRIFSVAEWYHFAFMAIALALLGFGSSGAVLSIFPSLLRRELRLFIACCGIAFACTAVGSYCIANLLPFDSFRLGWDRLQWLYLGAYFLVLFVPFFFSGFAIGAALAKMPQKAGELYASSMVGSGLGCLVAVAVPPLFGGGGSVVLIAAVSLVASVLLFWKTFKPGTLLSLAALTAFVFLSLNLPAVLEVRMSPYKGLQQALKYPDSRLLWTKWSAASRVDVVQSTALHMAPGLSLAYAEPLPTQLGIAIDGSDLNPVTLVKPDEAHFTDYLPTALPYHLHLCPKVLILDSGGSLDVETALSHSSSAVTVVVNHPLLVEAIQEQSSQETGVFEYPSVRLIVESPRSYLAGSEERFDIIIVSLRDSYQVVSAGAYTLTEDYRYTVQAFEEYYRHLTPQGMISVTRWLQLPPSETARLVSSAVTALENLGIEAPHSHVAAIRTLRTGTLLVSRSPLTSEDIERIKTFCEQRQFDTIYFLGIEPSDLNRYSVVPGEPYHTAFTNILSPSARNQFFRDHPYDVSPVSDDKPFFFHFFKWDQVPQVLRSFGKTWQPFGGAGYLLVMALLALVILASAVLILLPLYARGKTWSPSAADGTNQGKPGKLSICLYFAALGLGYLFIEIPLVQTFILFLGQPAYAFAVVLFTVLVFSGLGSLLAGRIRGRLPLVVVGLSVITAIYVWLLPSLFEVALGYSLSLRFAISVLSLAPLSLLMGIPFPWGIRMVGQLQRRLVPWAWAINGSTSVVGSVLSAMLALSFGFSWTLIAGACAYAVAASAAYFLLRKAVAAG